MSRFQTQYSIYCVWELCCLFNYFLIMPSIHPVSMRVCSVHCIVMLNAMHYLSPILVSLFANNKMQCRSLLYYTTVSMWVRPTQNSATLTRFRRCTITMKALKTQKDCRPDNQQTFFFLSWQLWLLWKTEEGSEYFGACSRIDAIVLTE